MAGISPVSMNVLPSGIRSAAVSSEEKKQFRNILRRRSSEMVAANCSTFARIFAHKVL